MPEAEERALLADCRARIEGGYGARGWLSPWISESAATPDLLAETGYRYTLNWCHDDQPTRLATRAGSLWSIPYPQELNDIPMIVARQMDARDFADMVVDNFDEMRAQSQGQPLVMGIALHAYLLGQPYRLRHLRRALEHILAADAITTPEQSTIMSRHCRRADSVSMPAVVFRVDNDDGGLHALRPLPRRRRTARA